VDDAGPLPYTGGVQVHPADLLGIMLGGAGRHLWQFTDGHLEVDPAAPRPVDVTISADPVALLLLSTARCPCGAPS
jgi:hypothetical protein